MSKVLAARLGVMLGDAVGIGFSPVAGDDGIWPEEAPAVARAVSKRRAEFAAGRRAARMALTGINAPEAAIPVGKMRAPLWPDGINGAITHDAGIALAAVMQGGTGLGVDLTEAAPLPGDTRRAILPHGKEAGFDPLSERAGFSAKETLFKALFPSVGAFFGFGAAVVQPNLAIGRFDIELVEDLGPYTAGAHWTGHVAILDGCLLTALIIA